MWRAYVTGTAATQTALLAVAVAVVLGLASPAHAFHTVTVTVRVTNVDNLGKYCYDPFLVCSRPDYFALITIRGAGADAVCNRTPFVLNRDHITPNGWICTQTVVGPASVRVAIYDFDGTGLAALDGHDHADVVAGGGLPFDATAPAVPGTTNTFAPSGEDSSVRFTVTTDVVPGTLSQLTTTPQAFDPSLGERVTISGTVSDPTHPGQLNATSLRLVIATGSGTVYESTTPTINTLTGRFEFQWNGITNAGSLASPILHSIYVFGSGGPLGTPTNPQAFTSTTVSVLRKPPEQLAFVSLAPTEPWNPRSGPLDITFSVSSPGLARLRVYGNPNCGSGVLHHSGMFQAVSAGQTTLQWNGRDALGVFALPGPKSVEISAVVPGAGGVNKVTSPPSVCANFEIAPTPPLELVVEHRPIGVRTNNIVFFTAWALDAAHDLRRTARIELWIATPAQVNMLMPPTTPGVVCAASSVCSFTDIAIAAAGGRFAYRAVASDEDGPTADTGWRAADATAPGVTTGPPTAAGVAMGAFGIIDTARTLDVVLFPGTGGTGDLPTYVRQFWGGIAPLSSDRFPSSFLTNQGNISYWLSPTTVSVTQSEPVTPNAPTNLCKFSLSLPPFAEAGIVIHRVACRDNAPGKTSSANAPTTAWHELHHALFGLADEYCCDGGYFSSGRNLFDSLATCTADPASAGGCAQLTNGTATVNWWRFDPRPDVMSWDRTREQRSDLRRANAIFAICRNGGC